MGLPQALARGEGSTAQWSACDAHMARAVSARPPPFAPRPAEPGATAAALPPRRKPHAHRQHAPDGHPRAPLLRLTGVERVAGPGRSASLAPPLGSEIGTARRQGPDAQHVGSWRGLAPQHAIAGGKGRKRRTRNKRTRAAPAVRLAAPAGLRADGALGAGYRRCKGRLGPAPALGATAHHLARAGEHMLPDRVPSHALGAAEENPRCRERERQ